MPLNKMHEARVVTLSQEMPASARSLIRIYPMRTYPQSNNEKLQIFRNCTRSRNFGNYSLPFTNLSEFYFSLSYESSSKRTYKLLVVYKIYFYIIHLHRCLLLPRLVRKVNFARERARESFIFNHEKIRRGRNASVTHRMCTPFLLRTQLSLAVSFAGRIARDRVLDILLALLVREE